jgi:CRISPR-associated protein (TIGR02584 family)
MENNDKKRHVLVAVSGMAPAVLTEAVWALSKRYKIIVDEIVVFTTSEGRDAIKEELLDSGVWNRLRMELCSRKPQDSMRLSLDVSKSIFIFENDESVPISDLRSYKENMKAADLMMKHLYHYASKEDYVIHGLISGGRKTMTALFYSCMCLLGRRGDKMYHVLTEEKYERNLDPPFYFPERGCDLNVIKNKVVVGKVKAADIKVDFFEVPFVHMGEWTEKNCRDKGSDHSYENLVALVDDSVRNALLPREVKFDFKRGSISLDDEVFNVSASEFVFLVFLLQGYDMDGLLYCMKELKEKIEKCDEEIFRNKVNKELKWFYKFGWKGKSDFDDREGNGPQIKQTFYNSEERSKASRNTKCRQDYSRFCHRLLNKDCEDVNKWNIFIKFLLNDLSQPKMTSFPRSMRIKMERRNLIPEGFDALFFPDDAKFPMQKKLKGCN